MILALFSILILIGLLSYYIIFSRIKISSFDINNDSFNEPVSVIICTKNELKNLKKHVSFWLNQNYSSFEVIIVNDQSTDKSHEFLELLKNEHHNLKILNIDTEESKELKGKRNALYKGIETSQNDYILLTDADCKPLSRNWIKEMTKAFINDKTDIILGYSPYKKTKGLLNKLIQFETLLTAMQYFGFTEFGIPYMAVGRNVAYRKSVLSKELFINSNLSIGGDDDLVVQQIANKHNTQYTLEKESLTESIAPVTFKEWFLQKKRHLSAGKHYKNQFKFILSGFYFFNILFIILLSYLLIVKTLFCFVLIALNLIIFKILFSTNCLFTVKNTISKTEFVLYNLIYWFFYTIFVIGTLF